MIIAASSTGQHHAVGMEGGSGDSGAAGLVQEGGVGLQHAELLAVEVEDFDGVMFSSAL